MATESATYCRRTFLSFPASGALCAPTVSRLTTHDSPFTIHGANRKSNLKLAERERLLGCMLLRRPFPRRSYPWLIHCKPLARPLTSLADSFKQRGLRARSLGNGPRKGPPKELDMCLSGTRSELEGEHGIRLAIAARETFAITSGRYVYKSAPP